MQWRRPITKSNGEARKQFSTWLIPAELREELFLVDGSECIVMAQVGSYSLEPKADVLTSGGEIRLLKADAEELRSHAEVLFTSDIIFDL